VKYFALRQKISLKKAIRLREWLSSWQGQEDSEPLFAPKS
jgi:hypothetical protein